MINFTAKVLSVRSSRLYLEREGRIFDTPLSKAEIAAVDAIPVDADGERKLIVTIAVADVAAKEGVA